MPGGKAIFDEVNDRIRAALRNLIATRGWDQTRAGDELGVTQQSISSFLNRNTGASLHLAWEIAKASRKTVDELLTGRPDGRSVRFGELPGWIEGEAEARRMFAHVPSDAFEAVRGWRAEEPPAVTPLIIGTLAEAMWKSLAVQASVPAASPSAEPKRARRTA